MVESDPQPTDGAMRHLRAALSRIQNLAEFSRVSGLNRRSLDRYKGGMEPSLSVAAQIAKALNLPLDALVYGKLDANPTDEASEDAILIPFLSVYGSAGSGTFNNGIEVIDRLSFSKALLRKCGVRPEFVHAITAKGDSMSPTILDGQIVLVDISVQQVRADAIYALTVGDDLRIKRIQRSMDGSLTLKSDNPNYEPETLAPVDAERLRIEGRVFWTEKVL